MSTDWHRRGEGVINASADFATGIGTAFKQLGSRVKRGRHSKVIDSICAVSGDVASQNGRLLVHEQEGFKSFILHSYDNPIFGDYSSEELLEKLKGYAIAAFLGQEEMLLRAANGVDRGSQEAQLVIGGALVVAFADGECDAREAACIARYASKLKVDLSSIAAGLNLRLPTSLLSQAPPRLALPRTQDSSSPNVLTRDPVPPALQPLCKRCYAFLVAGSPHCDCGRDLSGDYAVR